MKWSFSDIYTESGVRKWLEENYQSLGFSRLLREHTPEYNRERRIIVKRLMRKGLIKRSQHASVPDYLGLRDGNWLRIEVKGQTKEYPNPVWQSDIIVCYVQNNPEPMKFDGKEIFEVWRFLDKALNEAKR